MNSYGDVDPTITWTDGAAHVAGLAHWSCANRTGVSLATTDTLVGPTLTFNRLANAWDAMVVVPAPLGPALAFTWISVAAGAPDQDAYGGMVRTAWNQDARAAWGPLGAVGPLCWAAGMRSPAEVGQALADGVDEEALLLLAALQGWQIPPVGDPDGPPEFAALQGWRPFEATTGCLT